MNYNYQWINKIIFINIGRWKRNIKTFIIYPNLIIEANQILITSFPHIKKV